MEALMEMIFTLVYSLIRAPVQKMKHWSRRFCIGAKNVCTGAKILHRCKNVCTGAYIAPVFAPIPPVLFLFFSQSRVVL